VSRAALLVATLALASCSEDSPTQAPSAPSPPQEEVSRPAPGLVLIVADTLRADRGGVQEPTATTPHIDRLAADGASFENAFTHSPITLPAHVALFSSRPCHETGVITNGQLVPSELPLLAEHLQAHGWNNHAVTSLGSMRTGDPTIGLGRGFVTYARAGGAFIGAGNEVNEKIRPLLEEIDGEAPFFLFAHYSDPHEPYNDHEGAKTAEIRVDGQSLATVSTSNMTTWTKRLQLGPGEHALTIESDHELRLRTLALQCGGLPLEPRFIEGRQRVPSKRIELTFEVPPGSLPDVEMRLWLSDHPRRKETRRRYGSEVRYVDEQIGALLDELRARDLYDRSLIVFTSDHGESLGERRYIGHVRSLHDELLRVPLVIKPPTGSPQLERLRARETDLIAHIDVAPTILDLLDLPALSGQRGQSLLGGSQRPFVISQTYLPASIGEEVMAIDLLSIRDRARKLVYYVDEDRYEFFDLERDAGELTNVFDQLDETRAGWPAMLHAILELSATRLVNPTLDDETLATLEALGYIGD
jgi:arylsulfatase A-like enzyme